MDSRAEYIKYIANDIVMEQLKSMGYIRGNEEEYKDISLYRTLMTGLELRLSAIIAYEEAKFMAMVPTQN